MLKLKNTFSSNLLLDEGGLLYIWSAYKIGKKRIRQNGTVLIYSSFRPYADHLVAWLLKQRFPQLIWIADFRDPHVDLNELNVFFPKTQRKINKYLLKKADSVVSISQGLAKHLDYYQRPSYLMRNAINPSIQVIRTKEASFQKFSIAYTGSIYPELNDISPLFHILQKWKEEEKIQPDNFQLIYVGKSKEAWDQWVSSFGLEAFNFSREEIDLESVFAIQKRSHLNLLLSWSGPYIKGVLTGKLYEYLDAQRPILCLLYGDSDPEFEFIFKELHAGRVHAVREEDPTLEIFLKRLYEDWKKNGDINWSIDQKALQHYKWPQQIKAFDTYLTALIKKKNN